MKVLFYTRLNPSWLENIDRLRGEFPDVDFVTERERLESEVERADALVAGEMSLELIERAGNLKIVFVPYAGVDALPLPYIRNRGIRIANVHGNARYVAERAVAMTLAFYGKIIDYHNDLKRFQWHGYWAKGSVGDTWNSIREKTCAVIGTGAIGSRIGEILKVFGCPVIGFKKRPVTGRQACFDEITLDLNEALEKSELVFITLPLTEQTRGMFSADLLSRMEGKFLVNVGRGELVDEEGLYRALDGGILKGAAIDAWYNYPEKGKTTANPSRFPIHELPNVILSPHLAGFTPQAARLNIEQTMGNIRAYLKTGKANSEVSPDLLY